MITGILVPTSGTVRNCGLDPVPQRRVLAREIGVVFGQRSQLWWDLPLRDSFKILAAIHRLDPETARNRTARLVNGLGIADQLDTPVRQLSLGERMRGEVAAALVHSPRLLVLDEPTIGLDMISKERLRHFLITERAERGTTLLLTTHDMSDIEAAVRPGAGRRSRTARVRRHAARSVPARGAATGAGRRPLGATSAAAAGRGHPHRERG